MQPITPPELKEGETYGGAIINPDGTGHHFILLPEDKEESAWDEAMAWAKEQGGDLPNRVEQALLYDQSKDQFKPEWYWSNTQDASHSDSAWYQSFFNGYQEHWREDSRIRARAVRRILVIK